MFTTLTVMVPLVLPKDQGPMSVRVPQKLAKMSEIHTRGYNGETPKRRSPTTQPNVTIANQFTVKLQRAPKASRKNTCISFNLP